MLNIALLIGETLSAVIALLHLGRVVIGTSCYRVIGAGKQMAVLAERGHSYPPVVTGAIASVLLKWEWSEP